MGDKKCSLLTLHQLVDDNRFLDKTKLEEVLGLKMNFLDYVNLKQIINKNIILSNGNIKDLSNIEMPEYFCKKLYELFDPKHKGSQRFRKVFKYDNYLPPNFESEKWEKILKVKFCKGKEKEILKSIQNTYLPRYILDFKARLILGKTQSNSQLVHWANKYTSQACFMCQSRGDFELATLAHTLFECPRSQNTIDHICSAFSLPKNVVI